MPWIPDNERPVDSLTRLYDTLPPLPGFPPRYTHCGVPMVRKSLVFVEPSSPRAYGSITPHSHETWECSACGSIVRKSHTRRIERGGGIPLCFDP